MKKGKTYHVDSSRISQYEGERIVDDVTVEVTPKKTDKRVLCYSPYLKASVLIYKSDLK